MADQGTTRRADQQDESARSSDSGDLNDGHIPRTASRGRSRTTRQRGHSSSGRQYLFIDASTDRSTSSEAVRVHVMRESHRSRREAQGSSQSQAGSRRAPAQDEMVILDFRSPNTSRSGSPPASTATVDRTVSDNQPSMLDWTAVTERGVSAQMLSSMEELHRLAEACNARLSNSRVLLTRSDSGSARPPQSDVLRLSRGDFLSMSAYLALAMLQTTAGEQESTNVASVQFEARSLELLRLRLTQVTEMHTDHTIVAVFLLSQLEQQKNNLEAAVFHRNALQRLVQDRGGLDAIGEQNRELYELLSQSGLAEMTE